MDIERINSVLTKAILGFQDGEAEALFSLGEATAVGRTSYNVPAPGGVSKVTVSGDYPKGTVFVAMVVVRRSKMKVHPSRPQNSAYVVRRPKGSKESTIFITGIGKAYIIGPVSSGGKLRHLRNVSVLEESLGEATAVGRTSYNVPAPGQMYKPPSPKAMGIKKVEPLTQKNVRKGMPLGSIWIVTKASPKSVSIALQRDQGKSYSYRWDGMGYGKQGSYLHTDGETRALGDAGPVEAKVRYPQGTLFFSKGYKWSFVVTGPPVKQSYGGVVYPGRKPKGSKVYQLWVHDGQVRAMSLRGKDDMTLYNAMARIPA
jgi:hypothetical protein